MWRLASRLGGVTLARPLSIGSVLRGGLAAPALLRATSVTVPSLANLQQAGPASQNSRHDLRVALGLAAGATTHLSSE